MSLSVVPATGQERRQADANIAQDAQGTEPKMLDALHTEHGDTFPERNR